MPAYPEQILAWIHRWDDKPGARRGNKYQVRMSWHTQGVPDTENIQVENIQTGERLYIREF